MTEINENLGHSKNVLSGTSIPSNTKGENYDIYLQYSEEGGDKIITTTYIKLNGFWIESSSEYDNPNNEFRVGFKSIDANGIYMARDDSLDGYSQVKVNVSNGLTFGSEEDPLPSSKDGVNGDIHLIKSSPGFSPPEGYRLLEFTKFLTFSYVDIDLPLNTPNLFIEIRFSMDQDTAGSNSNAGTSAAILGTNTYESWPFSLFYDSCSYDEGRSYPDPRYELQIGYGSHDILRLSDSRFAPTFTEDDSYNTIIPYYNFVTIKFDMNSNVYIGDQWVYIASAQKNLSFGSERIILFGDYEESSHASKGGYFQYLKAWSGDDLIKNIIPVIDSDENVFLYDVVGDVFYSAEEGLLQAGPIKTEQIRRVYVKRDNFWMDLDYFTDGFGIPPTPVQWYNAININGNSMIF